MLMLIYFIIGQFVNTRGRESVWGTDLELLAAIDLSARDPSPHRLDEISSGWHETRRR
jgi:hypothetical protein